MCVCVYKMWSINNESLLEVDNIEGSEVPVAGCEESSVLFLAML